jgi:plasmid stabilization system protein ParE
MALKVVWTPQAIQGMEEVLDYLEKEWSAKEIVQFEKNLTKFVSRISNYPKIYPTSGKNPELRKGLVDKHNYMVYRINTNKRMLEIIHFRGIKQRPIGS